MMKSRLAVLAAAAIASLAMLSPAIGGNTYFLTDRNGQVLFPISPPNRANSTPGAIDNMIIGASSPQNGFFLNIGSTGQACTATLCVDQGLNAAQGGSINNQGGTSSTSANAGGASVVTGGTPGATGIGGAANVVGGAGGSTSGAGGAASVAGGVGTAGNAAGGAAAEAGGAGQGSAAGGAASVTGGVGGATGAGGAVNVAGGAGGATSGNGGVTIVSGGGGGTNGNGGSLVLQGGALNGTGINGSTRELGLTLHAQGSAGVLNSTGTLTAAQMLAGIITSTAGAAVAATLPLATAIDTAIPDAAAGDSFDFSVINTSGTPGNTFTIGTASGWTLVGSMVVTPVTTVGASGRFRAAKTGAGAWTMFRLS